MNAASRGWTKALFGEECEGGSVGGEEEVVVRERHCDGLAGESHDTIVNSVFTVVLLCLGALYCLWS